MSPPAGSWTLRELPLSGTFATMLVALQRSVVERLDRQQRSLVGSGLPPGDYTQPQGRAPFVLRLGASAMTMYSRTPGSGPAPRVSYGVLDSCDSGANLPRKEKTGLQGFGGGKVTRRLADWSSSATSVPLIGGTYRDGSSPSCRRRTK